MVVFSVLVGVSLCAGATIGAIWRPPSRVEGVLLAFASGALMSAVTLELVDQPVGEVGIVAAGVALIAGAVVFLVADEVLTWAGEAGGMVLLAGFVLDGVPETLALGTHPELPLLIAVIAANVPEALGGAAEMRGEGHRTRTILTIWVVASLLIAASGPAGAVVADSAGDDPVSLIQAFAGGAVLATLFTTLVPRAYGESGPLATVAGFLLSTGLAQ